MNSLKHRLRVDGFFRSQKINHACKYTCRYVRLITLNARTPTSFHRPPLNHPLLRVGVHIKNSMYKLLILNCNLNTLLNMSKLFKLVLFNIPESVLPTVLASTNICNWWNSFSFFTFVVKMGFALAEWMLFFA